MMEAITYWPTSRVLWSSGLSISDMKPFVFLVKLTIRYVGWISAMAKSPRLPGVNF